MPAPKPLSKTEIDAEIALLRAQVDRVRPTTAFGEDNKAAIEAQIAVLEEQLDEDEVDERAEDEGWEDNVKDAAQEAVKFWQGEPLDDVETLSENWEPLCD